MSKLPQIVKACLWSYDTEKMSLSASEDRFRIVLNILNRGTKEAVEWLWNNFSDEEIAGIIRNSTSSEWNKKSLSFWSHIYHVTPLRTKRFTPSYGISLEYTR